MGPFDNSAGAVTFWLFVLTISVVGTILPYLKHRETQRTIRAAIEKGQPIDPALLAEPRKKGDKAEEQVFSGVILLACGLGMGALGVAISLQAGQTIFPLFGVGVMLLFIGAALVGYGRWRMKARERADGR